MSDGLTITLLVVATFITMAGQADSGQGGILLVGLFMFGAVVVAKVVMG